MNSSKHKSIRTRYEIRKVTLHDVCYTQLKLEKKTLHNTNSTAMHYLKQFKENIIQNKHITIKDKVYSIASK